MTVSLAMAREAGLHLTWGTRRSYGTRPMVDLMSRFWAKVGRRPDDQCWPWLGYIRSDGQPRFWYFWRQVNARRVAWRLVRGAVPIGMRVKRLCDSRGCVNPAHVGWSRGPWKLRRPRAERFWQLVEKTERGCWLWQGARDAQGYGWFWDGRRSVRAHRFACGQSAGVLVNLCGHRDCVCPDHWFERSRRDD